MNIAQTDSYYITEASKHRRLKLRRSIGPLSGGTLVKMVSTNPDYTEIVVEAHGKKVTVSYEDLVITRYRR